MKHLRFWAFVCCVVSNAVVATSGWAACSGSGTSWTCTAGSTSAQVNSALDNAADGATITFAAGSYSWSGISLNNIDGVTLICATSGACNVSVSGDFITRDYIPSDVTGLIRISGFNFSGSVSSGGIWIYGARNIRQLRIDHNTFSIGAGQIAILLGETSSAGCVYGVIDHNTFTGTNNFMALKALTCGSTWVTGLQGSANNIFFEDNTVSFTNNSDLGTGAVDAWRATGIVVRYNSITNSRIVNHSLCHGGPANSEVYNNVVTSPTGNPAQYRNIHFQGSGEIIVWGNTVGGTSAGHIAIQHYRSDASQMPQGDCTASTICDGTETAYADENRSPVTTYRGYRCWHQPGSDGSGALKPVYLWNNRNASGARVAVSIESGGYIENHFAQNRDWYEAASTSAQSSPTSPFNGTSGVGFGTLANRPTTCTTGTESGGGVGYFATDQGTQGVLYRCSATNTWTVHYTPYTYPHPLQTVAGQTAPPTGLQAIPQ